MKGKKGVSVADIEGAVVSVLGHRIKLKPSVKYLQSAEEFVKEEFKKFKEENKEFREMDKEINDADRGDLL